MAIEPHALAQSESERLLSQGAETPHHFIYAIRVEPAREALGYIWYATVHHGTPRVAYVYHIMVKPGHRRQGHAKAALLQAEQLALGQGHEAMVLNLFVQNKAA